MINLPPIRWFYKGDKLYDKCNKVQCLFVIYNQLILLLNYVCKLFSYNSNPTHALLASKRRPFGLQKMLFKALINALLKSN